MLFAIQNAHVGGCLFQMSANKKYTHIALTFMDCSYLNGKRENA